MKKRAWIIAGYCLVVSLLFVTVANSADNGAFGNYLAGTFSLRDGHTVVLIINPTPAPEDVCVAFFNQAGAPLTGRNVTINSNGMIGLDVREFKLGASVGVVKAVVRKPESATGIVGFQRFFSAKTGIAAESNLASVPLDIMMAEHEKVMKLCK